MAVKPATALPEWASDLNFTTGEPVYQGKPTKVSIPAGVVAEGLRGGKNAPIAAEHFNDWLNLLSKYIEWVRLGSAAGAADAHVLETGADGRFQVEGITVSPANVVGAALVVNIPPTSGNALSLLGGNTANDYLAKLTPSGASGGMFIDASATTGRGLLIEGNSGANATLRVRGNLAIQAVSTGALEAISAVGSATSTDAVAFTTNNPSGTTLRVTGAASAAQAAIAIAGTSGAGWYGLGGTTSGVGVYAPGVKGEARADVLGVGVYGLTSATAGVAAAGVRGEGRADGSGGEFFATDGYGIRLSASGPRAHLLMSGRLTDPSIVATGTLWHRNYGGRGRLKTFVDTAARILCHSAGGSGFAWDSDLAGGTVDNSVTTILSCTLTGADSPVVAGTVWILVTFELGRSAAGAADADIQVSDLTKPEVIINDTAIGGGSVRLLHAGPVYERHVTYILPYSLDSDGDRTFAVTLASTTAVDLQYRNAAMAVIGVF